MGRHVNFADEQERWLNKADKITKNIKHQKLEDRDPASLTLAEQFELAKRQKLERDRLKEIDANKPKRMTTHYSHYKPKQG
jgi:hypothetical protein